MQLSQTHDSTFNNAKLIPLTNELLGSIVLYNYSHNFKLRTNILYHISSFSGDCVYSCCVRNVCTIQAHVVKKWNWNCWPPLSLLQNCVLPFLVQVYNVRICTNVCLQKCEKIQGLNLSIWLHTFTLTHNVTYSGIIIVLLWFYTILINDIMILCS